jgi:hypothetical protein
MYQDYLTGLQNLLNLLGEGHSRYPEALDYKERLEQNIRKSKRFGDTDARKAERAEILAELNEFTQEVLGKWFTTDLCKRKDVLLEPASDDQSAHTPPSAAANTSSSSETSAHVNLQRLVQALTEYFDLSELEMLCLGMNIEYEALPGDTRPLKAKALVEYCKRHARLQELRSNIQKERPHVELD